MKNRLLLAQSSELYITWYEYKFRGGLGLVVLKWVVLSWVVGWIVEFDWVDETNYLPS